MATIIDFHTHTFPDELAAKAVAKLKDHAPGSVNYTDGTVNGLLASMAMAGIDKSVTLPIATKPEQVATINRAAVDSKVDGIIAFGTIHPDTPDIDATLDLLIKGGVKGIKLHPEYQNFYIDNPRYYPLYEALASRGLIVLFHAGKDPGPFTCDHALPAALAHVCSTFPSLTVIASHMGGWMLWPDVETVLAGKPLYFDTAATAPYLDKNHFVRLAKKHGIERILFGSDSPWFNQKSDVAWIESLPISSTEKEMILGTNARKLLGI